MSVIDYWSNWQDYWLCFRIIDYWWWFSQKHL